MSKKAGKQGSSTSTSPTSARLLKNRPLDPNIDEVEVRPKAEVFKEAAAQLGPENIETPQQAELLASPETAAEPVAVQNGRMLATYVGLGLERDKHNGKLVHLDFSFPLEEVHNGFIPNKVAEAWAWLKFSNNPLVKVGGIPAVTVSVYSDPNKKRSELHLIGADISKAVIQVVEEVGKGKAKMVTRFAFRLRVKRDLAVIDFAAWRDGEEFWIKMQTTQAELGE
jgi:hypothetical protein